jgi:hypothetical protein
MLKPALTAIALVMMMDVCGYHRAGMGKGLPPDIKTIAIPTFHNTSLKYRVEQRFTQAIMDEVLKHGHGIRVTSDPDNADAVLTGDIRRFRTTGALLDPQGRTRVWQLTITTAVVFRDLKTRKILYQNPSMHFLGTYEVADNPDTYFDQSNTAVDRIAKEFAQSIVSTIMEGM